jgi:hypothetical protein
MEDILNSMDPEIQESMASSSREAKRRRGIGDGKPDFSHDEAIEVQQMVINRLEENYAQVVKELEGLESAG